MFISSVSFLTANFDVKRSFNELKLIFLSKEVYLISYMIYYMIINANNQNNSYIVQEKRFNTSILFKTAYYNVYSTFNMFKVGLLTKDVY